MIGRKGTGKKRWARAASSGSSLSTEPVSYTHLDVYKRQELGRKQELKVLREKEFGVYLGEQEHPEASVLLPKKQVPEGTKIGDSPVSYTHLKSFRGGRRFPGQQGTLEKLCNLSE